MGIPQIVQPVEPQVVTVLTEEAVGSGVIFRSDGIIFTNEHVVGDNTTVLIASADGRHDPGRVLATDKRHRPSTGEGGPR